MSASDIRGANRAVCLCGNVEIAVTLASHAVGACHCTQCTRWTAGPFLAVEARCESIAGTDSLSVYRSSEHGERGFCRNCGSTLFWREPDGEGFAISATALVDTRHLSLASEIFIDSKPDWYAFSNSTTKMTGAMVMAGAPSSGQGASR